jgi:hypothetical protein
VHDVGILDARRQTRLVEEHVDERRILGEVRVDDLDRHGLGEARCARATAQVERGHAASAQRREHLVLADSRPRVEHHGHVCPNPSSTSRTSPMAG